MATRLASIVRLPGSLGSRKAARAGPPPPPPPPPPAAWGAAGAAVALGGAAELLAPGAVAGQLDGWVGPEFLAIDNVAVNAAFAPLSAASCAVLARAAAQGADAYKSLTYGRLELALLVANASRVAALAAVCAAGGCEPALVAAGLAASAPAAVLGGIGLSKREGVVRGAVEDLKAGFDVLGKGTYTSQYLASQFVIGLLVGGSFAASPKSPLANPVELVGDGPEALAAYLLRCQFGIEALFVLGPVVWLLADAADRGQLRAPPFRALSFGAGVATCLVDAGTLRSVADIAAALGGDASLDTVDTTQLPNLISALAIAGIQAGVYFWWALVPGGEDDPNPTCEELPVTRAPS